VLDEWQLLGFVHDAKTLNDLNDGSFEVHGVEMKESASSIH